MGFSQVGYRGKRTLVIKRHLVVIFTASPAASKRPQCSSCLLCFMVLFIGHFGVILELVVSVEYI